MLPCTETANCKLKHLARACGFWFCPGRSASSTSSSIVIPSNTTTFQTHIISSNLLLIVRLDPKSSNAATLDGLKPFLLNPAFSSGLTSTTPRQHFTWVNFRSNLDLLEQEDSPFVFLTCKLGGCLQTTCSTARSRSMASISRDSSVL